MKRKIPAACFDVVAATDSEPLQLFVRLETWAVAPHMSAFSAKADIASYGIRFVTQTGGEMLMPTYIMLVNFTDQGRKGINLRHLRRTPEAVSRVGLVRPATTIPVNTSIFKT
jgi:hypothetical protein